MPKWRPTYNAYLSGRTQHEAARDCHAARVDAPFTEAQRKTEAASAQGRNVRYFVPSASNNANRHRAGRRG